MAQFKNPGSKRERAGGGGGGRHSIEEKREKTKASKTEERREYTTTSLCCPQQPSSVKAATQLATDLIGSLMSLERKVLLQPPPKQFVSASQREVPWRVCLGKHLADTQRWAFWSFIPPSLPPVAFLSPCLLASSPLCFIPFLLH